MIDILQYPSNLLSSNMYLLACEDKAIVIDPWVSDKLAEWFSVQERKVDYIILTHEHYDHISGVNWLKDHTQATVLCSEECGKAMAKPSHNYSKYFDALIDFLPEEYIKGPPVIVDPYSSYGDVMFNRLFNLDWQGHRLELMPTPGHSKGSICILLDRKHLFSGDSLLKDFPVITKFRGGDIRSYESTTLKYLSSLEDDVTVYPGHFEIFNLKDRLKEIQ